MEIVYLRFGDLPPDGRSRNPLTGTLLSGVSVYEAIAEGETYRILMPAMTAYHWDAMCEGLKSCYGRPCYIVTGNLFEGLDLGSPLETLLTDVQIIKAVNPCVGPQWGFPVNAKRQRLTPGGEPTC